MQIRDNDLEVIMPFSFSRDVDSSNPTSTRQDCAIVTTAGQLEQRTQSVSALYDWLTGPLRYCRAIQATV